MGEGIECQTPHALSGIVAKPIGRGGMGELMHGEGREQNRQNGQNR